MAYGDITNSPNAYRSPSKPGVQTVRKAVLLKDGSSIGSAAVNYLSDTKTLEQLTSSSTASTTATKAVLHKNAGIYVGTAGNIMVNFSFSNVVYFFSCSIISFWKRRFSR